MSIKVPYFTIEQLQNSPGEFVDKLNSFASEVAASDSPAFQISDQTLTINSDTTVSFPWRIVNTSPSFVGIARFTPVDGDHTHITSVGALDWYYSAGTVFITKIYGTYDFGIRYNIRLRAEV
jgi:hypothetical protein